MPLQKQQYRKRQKAFALAGLSRISRDAIYLVGGIRGAPFQPLLDSELVKRIYLEDLQQVATDSLGIGLVRLVVADANVAVGQAQVLLN